MITQYNGHGNNEQRRCIARVKQKVKRVLLESINNKTESGLQRIPAELSVFAITFFDPACAVLLIYFLPNVSNITIITASSSVTRIPGSSLVTTFCGLYFV